MVRDTWQTLYEFTTQTRPQIDLKVASWYASTHPASKFVTGLTAAVITDDARWNLSGRDLAVHRAGGTEKIRLADAAAVVDTLSERFGINVADIGERGALETRIDELLARQPEPMRRKASSMSPLGPANDIRTNEPPCGVEIDSGCDRNTGVGQQL